MPNDSDNPNNLSGSNFPSTPKVANIPNTLAHFVTMLHSLPMLCGPAPCPGSFFRPYSCYFRYFLKCLNHSNYLSNYVTVTNIADLRATRSQTVCSSPVSPNNPEKPLPRVPVWILHDSLAFLPGSLCIQPVSPNISPVLCIYATVRICHNFTHKSYYSC